jgi:hypothetical protein
MIKCKPIKQLKAVNIPEALNDKQYSRPETAEVRQQTSSRPDDLLRADLQTC